MMRRVDSLWLVVVRRRRHAGIARMSSPLKRVPGRVHLEADW